MAKAVRFHVAGGPDVLTVEDVDVGDPGPGEVRIRHAAIGCNFADTYFRSGYYPVQPPCGIGVEGAGVVEAIGAGVTGFAVGDDQSKLFRWCCHYMELKENQNRVNSVNGYLPFLKRMSPFIS